ncbi:MAG: ferredoxin [Actinomycetota bacterium]|nr:ferredoxin [Actinomycetota bacterium]
MAIEVVIQRARCIGVKSCINAAPSTFAMDASMISTVVNPTGDPESDVVAAADNCPTGAISVFRDGVRIA